MIGDKAVIIHNNSLHNACCRNFRSLYKLFMPVMNGYEATKSIRALESKELSSVPIVAMTANAFDEDRKAAAECGMNGSISKPINIAEVKDTLHSVLNKM